MPECLYHTAFSVAEQRAKLGLGGVSSRERDDDRGGRDRSRVSTCIKGRLWNIMVVGWSEWFSSWW